MKRSIIFWNLVIGILISYFIYYLTFITYNNIQSIKIYDFYSDVSKNILLNEKNILCNNYIITISILTFGQIFLLLILIDSNDLFKNTFPYIRFSYTKKYFYNYANPAFYLVIIIYIIISFIILNINKFNNFLDNLKCNK